MDFGKTNVQYLNTQQNCELLRKSLFDEFVGEDDNENFKEFVETTLESKNFYDLLTFGIEDLKEELRETLFRGVWLHFKVDNHDINCFLNEIDNTEGLAALLDDDVLITEFSEYMGFENDDNEEKETEDEPNIKQTYVVELHIKSHRYYAAPYLFSRIWKRLRYKWGNVELNSLDVELMENGKWLAMIEFTTEVTPLQEIDKRIHFRFGSTSGRPWNGCKIMKVAFG